MAAKRSLQQPKVSKMTFEEMEDQYLRISEENSILKAHGRKQEEKIKKMATKLVRLINDRKREQVSVKSAGRTARDVGLEETIENQQELLRKYEKDSNLLKQKLHVMHQQLQSKKLRNTPFDKVSARIDSRRNPKPNSDHDDPNLSNGNHSKISTRAASPPRYGHSLLEKSRNENHRLEEQVIALQNQVVEMQHENETLHQQIRTFHAAHESDVLKFHEHISLSQRSTVGENIELIKLQRQMKEKVTNLSEMEMRFHQLQSSYNQLRTSYDKVLHETESLKSQLQDEETENISLQNQLKHGTVHHMKLGQQNEQIRELEKEIDILKEANENLLNRAFDQEKEHQWRKLEKKLRVQIAQLEAAIKSDAADKIYIFDKIEKEKGFVSQVHSNSRKVNDEASRLRMENEELRERIKLYTMSDDVVDVNELKEALAKVRQKKYGSEHLNRPSFLASIEDDSKDPVLLHAELQSQHAETIQELEKTREMLLMQHKINKDYQIEVETVSNQIVEIKREYEHKLKSFARLLDARAARIKKLETQLHDVAYGTKQFKMSGDSTIDDEEELDETIQLERGDNLLEINVSKLTLSQEALQNLDDRDPSIFVTYAFYDYELVSTPILKSASPLFGFTAQFLVQIDDLFLHYIQKEYTLFEIHQALGTEHKTVATCRVRFNQLLEKPQGKLHGSVAVTGLNGCNYGSLDYWVRLRVPMDQAIRLYRERAKALGYLSANLSVTQNVLEINNSQPDSPSSDDTNQLFVHIVCCNHVESRKSGTQPNIYCVYKFFDFADHDTAIIPNSNNPHFDDRQAYPVQVSHHLDAYLKTEKLLIYVFDDVDPDVTSYLGKAVIDLIPLAHNKHVKAPFQLTKGNGEDNGTIEVALRWQLEYKSPGVLFPSKLSETEDEEIKQTLPLVKKPPVTPKKRVLRSSTSYSAASQTLQSTDMQQPVEDDEMENVPTIEPERERPKPMTRKSQLFEKHIAVESSSISSNDDHSCSKQPHLINEEEIEEVSSIMELPILDRIATDNEDDKESIKSDLESFTSDNIDIENKNQPHASQNDQDVDVESGGENKVKTNFNDDEDKEGNEVVADLEDNYDDDNFENASISEHGETFENGPTKEETEELGSASLTVSINHFTLENNTSMWDDVEQIFVEYEFLGSVEEMPNSVPIPSSKEGKIPINFHSVHDGTHKEKRDILADMLKTGQSTFKFTVVSEPVDDDGEKECDEIGTASFDIASILKNGTDVQSHDIQVQNLINPRKVIGNLNIDVKALQVLKVIKLELKARLEEDDKM